MFVRVFRLSLAMLLILLISSPGLPLRASIPQDLVNHELGSWSFWFVILDDGVFNGYVDPWLSMVESQDPVVRLIESLGGRVIHRHWIVNAVSFEGSVELVYKLRSMGYTVTPSLVFKPQIVYIGRDVEPLDMIGVDTIGARRLHELGITGAGVKVAILDTGVENLHPWLMRDGRSVVKWEVDATGRGIEDYCGKRIGYHEGGAHGTHIAGIVAGQHPKTPGIAPGASVYDVIVFREELNCWAAFGHDILRGIELALLGPDGQPNTGDEADVINLSLGAVEAPWFLAVLAGKTEEVVVVTPLLEGMRRAVDLGKLVVVAAANAAGHYTLNYFCGVQGVICVGSSNQMGTGVRGDDRLSWFSSRGPMPWYDVGPTLVAPGENIYSTIPTALAIQLGLEEPALTASGTSMAAPHVSGALALLLEHYRELGRSLTVDTATRLLVHSSTSILTTEASNIAGPHEAGAGLLNVYNAAFSDMLVDVNGGYIASVVALDEIVNLELTIHNIGTTDSRASVRVWLDDTFRPPREGFEHAITISPESIDVPAGGRVTVTVSIDTSKLLPGLYGGYVDVIVGERSYRAAFSLLVPGKPVVEGFRVKSEIPVLVARYMGPYWTFIEWSMVPFYLDRPLGEYTTIRVVVNDICAIPVIALTFDPKTGYMLSSGYSGYLLGKPGLYLVFLEVDFIDWLLGFHCGKSLQATVVLEAPLLENTLGPLVSKLQNLELRVSELSQRLLSLEGRVGGLESRIANLESKVSTLEQDVSTIKSKISDMESKLSTLALELSSLQSRVERLSSEVANISLKVSSLEDKLSTLTLNVSRLERSLAKLESRTSSLEAELEKAKRELIALNETIERVEAELRDSVRRLQNEIASTRKDLEELASRLEKEALELRQALNTTESKLLKNIEELASRLEKEALELRQALNTTESKLLKNIEELASRLEKEALELRQALNTTESKLLKNIEELASRLEKEALELRQALNTTESKLLKNIEEQASRVEALLKDVVALDRKLGEFEESLVEVNKTTNLKLEDLKSTAALLEGELTILEGELSKFKLDLERLYNNLEEAREHLETRILEESSKAREAGERGTVMGAIALVTGLLAIAITAYQTIRRKAVASLAEV